MSLILCLFGIVGAITMPGLISVGEFVEETREDYNSPTTSTFVSRMPQCRQTVGQLEEVSYIQVRE